MKPRYMPLEGTGEGLKVTSVIWNLRDKRGNDIQVKFFYDVDGKPEIVSLFWGGNEDVGYIENNENNLWKSCVTHVKALVRHFCYRAPKKPRGLHDAQKLRKSMPALKVVG